MHNTHINTLTKLCHDPLILEGVANNLRSGYGEKLSHGSRLPEFGHPICENNFNMQNSAIII